MGQVNSGNYPIPNDTGANVLADINENLNALNSNNSGTTEPSNKQAHQFFVDESTTPDTLKIRDASNANYIELGKLETDLGHMPKTGGTFTGNIRINSGTNLSPSLQLNDDNTGLYLPSANVIGLTTDGTLRAEIGSIGLTLHSGAALRLKDPENNNYIDLKSPALSSDLTFTLPNSDGNNGDFLKSDGSGALSWAGVAGVPTGSVHCMATTNIPDGYAECNGATVTKGAAGDEWYALWLVIGYTWGGSGNSFNLPDLRGRFIRGWVNTKSGDDDSGRSFANYQSSRNKSHNHSINVSVSQSNHSHSYSRAVRTSYAEPRNLGVGTDGNANNSGTTNGAKANISVSATAGNQGGDDARPNNLSMMYVIKK